MNSFLHLMHYFVYILFSEKLNQFYKGSTSDLQGRIQRHNAGLELHTSKGVPWRLIWSTVKDTKSEAYQLELKLKNLSVNRMCQFIIKYAEGTSSPDELLFIKQLSGC